MTLEKATTWNKRIAAQIGAGLGFALSSLFFFATGQWRYLILAPVGALVGLAVGALLHHYPGLRENAAHALDAVRSTGATILAFFAHERLLVRFARLFLVGVILFLATWSIAYGFLPERLLARGDSVRMMGNDEVATTLWAEWRFMIVRNLPWVPGIALISLLLGYAYALPVPLLWIVLYALILGTNSFSIPLPALMPPSLAVLERAGPYEMLAYLFAAAASYSLAKISLPWRKVDEASRVHGWNVALALLASAAVIMLAAWREAAMLLSS
ncbi:MAG: hypothetical protein ACP5HM_16625 [Anaerolineae bacterium]